MLDTERKVGTASYAEDGAARRPLVPQDAESNRPKALPPREEARRIRRFSSPRSFGESSPSGRDKVDYPKDDEWTAREAFDYALKRASGHAADEERVAIAIFYSMFPDAGNCYAAMDEKGKERMRWCARAAIAALKKKS